MHDFSHFLRFNKYSPFLKCSDPELTKLLRREDKEAVSHLPPDDPKWFSDPQHLLTSMGKYPTLESQNISTRVVSPVDRGAGRFGVEIATKVTLTTKILIIEAAW